MPKFRIEGDELAQLRREVDELRLRLEALIESKPKLDEPTLTHGQAEALADLWDKGLRSTTQFAYEIRDRFGLQSVELINYLAREFIRINDIRMMRNQQC